MIHTCTQYRSKSFPFWYVKGEVLCLLYHGEDWEIILKIKIQFTTSPIILLYNTRLGKSNFREIKGGENEKYFKLFFNCSC